MSSDWLIINVAYELKATRFEGRKISPFGSSYALQSSDLVMKGLKATGQWERFYHLIHRGINIE